MTAIIDGPWRARFLDGPGRAHERLWAVGPPWERIVLTSFGRLTLVVVDGDGFPYEPEREPWPDESTYELDHVIATDGQDTMGAQAVAYYRLAD
jgi:hypothetical protein